MHTYQLIDLLALKNARRRQRWNERIQNSNLSGTWTECLYRNKGDFSVMNTTGALTSILSGQNQQPVIPANFFDQFPQRAIGIVARGILSPGGTPTYTMSCNLNSTIGLSQVTGAILGVSAAVTMANTANSSWMLRIDAICTTAGQGSGNSTLTSAGEFWTGAGNPNTIYGLAPNAPPSATWTCTLDDSVSQYLNLAANISATGSILCKELLVWGYN